MATPSPLVRSLILCEEIITDATNSKRVSLVNLVHAIRPEQGYPHRHDELCVFIQLTGCRGPGEIRVAIQEADAEQVVCATPQRRVSLSNDPLKLHGIPFRILQCVFPRAGLYWVQFWHDDTMVAQTPLKLVEE